MKEASDYEDRRLYPMKFFPLFKEKIWGGENIRKILGLNYGTELKNCGEAWVLSGMEGDESVVANGFLEGNNLAELVEVYMGDLVGEKIYQKFGLQFPLLFKWIDAADDLSVQVHPDNALAAERGEGLGKNEMWFVRRAQEGPDCDHAHIVCGFRQGVNQMRYLKAMQNNSLEEVLQGAHVHAGDAFYIPAGTVHSIGKGILLAEIQQSSDSTYRIYDWDRTGEDGNARELHVEQALKALKFSLADFAGDGPGRVDYPHRANQSNPLVDTPEFTVNYLPLMQAIEKDFSDLDSFVVYMCTKGAAVLKADGKVVEIKQGELVLVPALMEKVSIYPDTLGCELLETYIV